MISFKCHFLYDIREFFAQSLVQLKRERLISEIWSILQIKFSFGSIMKLTFLMSVWKIYIMTKFFSIIFPLGMFQQDCGVFLVMFKPFYNLSSGELSARGPWANVFSLHCQIIRHLPSICINLWTKITMMISQSQYVLE